jgi:hypothetical protein
LLKFKPELGKSGDNDYHLVIVDDTLQFSQGQQVSTHSFVAEIVKPECVPGRHGDPGTESEFGEALEAVWNKFEERFPDSKHGWNDAGGMRVRLTGVGFFDRPHGQTGRAPNMIELHPLLDIEFLDDATTVECSRCRRRNGKERSRTASGDPAPSNHGLNHRTSMGAHQLSGCPRVNPAAMRAPCGLVAR